MAQLSILGRFRKRHLGNELWRQECHIVFADVRCKRRILPNQPLEFPAKGRERAFVKPRPDFSNITEFIPVVDTEKQRSKMLPRTSRRREPSNYKFFFLVHLYFSPFRRTSFHIDRGQVLGDDTLESFAFRHLKRPHSVFRQSRRNHQALRGFHKALEDVPPDGKYFLSKILAIGIKAVEHRIQRWAFSLLQKLKARNSSGVKNNNLAVQQQCAGA